MEGLRQALAQENPLQIVGTINAYAALLAKRAGFKAIYLSGAGVANAAWGLPDLGMRPRILGGRDNLTNNIYKAVTDKKTDYIKNLEKHFCQLDIEKTLPASQDEIPSFSL